MSFFTLSTGQQAAATGEFESAGGDLAPIPAGTQVLAAIDQAKWDTNQDRTEDFIALRWTIALPDEYKNRKIFQKVRVNNPDADKADTAIMMLAAIDANAGGKLMASGEPPTDQAMSCLFNRPMVLKLGLWKNTINGEEKSGNWVQKVAPRKAGGAAPAPAATPAAPARPAAPVARPAVRPAPAPAFTDDDDCIPF